MTENLIEIDMYSVIKQKYIERDVLDKIRAEIEELYYIDEGLSFCPQISREDVLKIIDKYKAESEINEKGRNIFYS